MDLRPVAALVLAAATLLGGAARAADAVVQPSLAPVAAVWEPFDEIRVGGFAHNVIHNENSPVDASLEALSAPIFFPGHDAGWVAGNPWLSWFFNPRLNLGAMINTGGKTSYVFTGFVWRIPIFSKFFFEGEFGGALNNAERLPTPDRVDMGCPATFRESGGFGYQFSENWDLIASVEHVSHATFCSKINPGLTQFGVRVGYKF